MHVWCMIHFARCMMHLALYMITPFMIHNALKLHSQAWRLPSSNQYVGCMHDVWSFFKIHDECCLMHLALCMIHLALWMMLLALCLMHLALGMMHLALCMIHLAWFMMHYSLCVMHLAWCIIQDVWCSKIAFPCDACLMHEACCMLYDASFMVLQISLHNTSCMMHDAPKYYSAAWKLPSCSQCVGCMYDLWCI